MKKTIAVIAITAAVLSAGTTAYAHQGGQDNNKGEDHKILVCHPTGGETNPFVVISVDKHSENAEDFPYLGPISHHKGDKAWCETNRPPVVNPLPVPVPEPSPVNPPVVPAPNPKVPVTPPAVTPIQTPDVPGFQGK